MNTSYSRKLTDFIAAGIRSPRDLLDYARHIPAWGRQPSELEIPWFSYGAIRFLAAHVNRGHAVFEFGSGGSSFFFARRAASVTAMETHATWHDRVRTMAAARGITNLDCQLHPLGDGQLENYRASPFFQRVRDRPWDIIVIDCFCGFLHGSYGELRRHAFEVSLDHVSPGGLIVLDDSWLFPELLTERPGWSLHDHVGLGPCRYGVTSTAIFRRLP